MPLLSEDVETFLANTRCAGGRDLEVAIVYAELMAEALRTGVAEWEVAAARLREIKGRYVVDSN
jgi:hypothetical protein